MVFKKIKQKTNEFANFITDNYKMLGLSAAMTLLPTIQQATAQTQNQNTQQTTETNKENLERLLKRTIQFENQEYEELTRMLEKELYPKSGHLYKLDLNATNPQIINETSYNNVRMVGENVHTDQKITGMFLDEAERNWSTTYASFCNHAGCTKEELKNIITLSNGINPEDMNVIKNRDGDFVSVTYTGTEPRQDIRNRVMIDGRVIENHINWPRGETMTAPTHLLFSSMGYDFQTGSDILDDYQFYEDKIEQITQEKEEEKEELEKEKEEIEKEKEELEEKTRKIKGNVGAYISNNTDISYGIGISWPTGENNRNISVIGTYSPGTTTEETSPIDEQVFNMYDNQGNLIQRLTETEYTTTNTAQQGASTFLTYEILDNVSIGPGLDFTRTNTTVKDRRERLVEKFDANQEPYDTHFLPEEKSTTTTTNKFNPAAIITLDLGRINLDVSYTFGKNEAKAGIRYDLFKPGK